DYVSYNDLDKIYNLGGSSGGARPKAHIVYGGDEWIVKFPCQIDAKDIGIKEFKANELCVKCGINTNDFKLFESNICKGYFGVKRFDRLKNENHNKVKIENIDLNESENKEINENEYNNKNENEYKCKDLKDNKNEYIKDNKNENEYKYINKNENIDLKDNENIKDNENEDINKNANKKVHMISLCALLETSHRYPNLDYGHLFQVISTICVNSDDLYEAFRRMCFNVFYKNRDDHGKNFSFLYDENLKSYKLSPAYDITACPNLPEHQMTVNGNGNPTVYDLMEIAKDFNLSINVCEDMIKNIKSILS
ncbi:MAG: type II toxin-antitoxin system HipA family toxin, partial [Christensenellales bacterium]